MSWRTHLPSGGVYTHPEPQSHSDWRWAQPEGPHGGALETIAKWAFVVAAVMLAVVSLQGHVLMAERPLALSEFERAMLVTRAEAIERDYNATGARWTNTQVTDARGELIRARDRLERDSHEGRRVQRVIDRVVRDALDRRYSAAEESHGNEQQQAITARSELQRMFDMQGMDGHGAVEQQVDQMGNTMWMPKPKPEERSALWGVVKFGGLLYLLFMPFVLCAFLARMAKFGMSVGEELYFGWQNLLGSVVFWPFALGNFPRSTARELRRTMIEAEFLARVGKRWASELTEREQVEVERLVDAPMAELRQRLAEIQMIPAEALLRARFAVYATMVAAFLLGPFASSARADSRTIGAVNKAVAVELVQPLKFSGFAQAGGGGPKVPWDLTRAWLIMDAEPQPAVAVRFVMDMRQPALLHAFATAKLGGPFAIRAGQIVGRGADPVPRPDKERLIGGPGASALVTFFESGAEVSARLGRTELALQVLSGSGKNTPDANAGKDVVASLATGPWGPMCFQLIFQAGEQPDGFRTRSAANVVGTFGKVTVDALGTHERFGDVDSFAASTLVGWRVHELVDLAAGADELRVHKFGPMAPPYAPDRVERGQVTLHLYNDTVQVGAQYRHSDAAGHQGLGRLQVSF